MSASYTSRQESPSVSENTSSTSVKSSRRSRKSATAFRTISEVADILGVQQHVLRFWETKFTQVKPLKRGGGRRYYRPEDVEILKQIHHLLYTEGYTIKGVQKLLKGHGKNQIIAQEFREPQESSVSTAVAPEVQEQVQPIVQSEGKQSSTKQKAILEAMLGDLKELRDLIKGD